MKPKAAEKKDPFDFEDDDFNFDAKPPKEEKESPKEQPAEKKPATKKGFLDLQPTNVAKPADKETKPEPK